MSSENMTSNEQKTLEVPTLGKRKEQSETNESGHASKAEIQCNSTTVRRSTQKFHHRWDVNVKDSFDEDSYGNRKLSEIDDICSGKFAFIVTEGNNVSVQYSIDQKEGHFSVGFHFTNDPDECQDATTYKKARSCVAEYDKDDDDEKLKKVWDVGSLRNSVWKWSLGLYQKSGECVFYNTLYDLPDRSNINICFGNRFNINKQFGGELVVEVKYEISFDELHVC